MLGTVNRITFLLMEIVQVDNSLIYNIFLIVCLNTPSPSTAIALAYTNCASCTTLSDC
jgi:hypothetical protein